MFNKMASIRELGGDWELVVVRVNVPTLGTKKDEKVDDKARRADTELRTIKKRIIR